MQLTVNAVRPTVSYRALDLGADNFQLGLIAAGFAVLSLLLAIPAGRAIDRRGEMPFIILGLALVAGVAFALVGVQQVWALFVTQAVLGLGQILTTVGMQALIANSDPQHRDSRFGTFTVVVSLGQLAGPTVAGVLEQHAQLGGILGRTGGAVFLASGVAGVIGLLLAVSARHSGSADRGDRETSRQPHEPIVRGVATVLRQPNAPHAMLSSIAVLTTVDLLVAYLPAYGESTGLSETTVGLLLSARAAASMFSRILMTPMIRLVGHGRLLVLSTAVPALSLAPLTFVTNVPLAVTALVLAGFGLGLGQPLSLIWIAQSAPTHMRGTAVGVRLSGNRLGQVAIPALAAGVVGVSGLAAVFISMAALLAVSAVVTATGSFAPTDDSA